MTTICTLSFPIIDTISAVLPSSPHNLKPMLGASKPVPVTARMSRSSRSVWRRSPFVILARNVASHNKPSEALLVPPVSSRDDHVAAGNGFNN
ncbi:Arogenate dehydratase/prephenate dehydratase 6 [Cardamine amara subsp. amara]|uniref:Arogenate dehydratase/prephenate dehydratase 6 n=1 Tax=Cardamine amara subsp. amara TaxID=228776 RepID=A0ABD1A505_CARAN